MKNKILAIDLETGGLDEKLCGLTQVSGIIYIDGEEVETFNFDVKPFEGSTVNAKALEVTGKTFDEVMGYRPEEEVFKDFTTILKKYINPMSWEDSFTQLSYNAPFDQRFLIEWFGRCGRKFPNYISYKTVDPLAFLRILDAQGITNLKSYKLSLVYKAIFNKEFDAHDAEADIRATMEVYDYLVEYYIMDPRGRVPTGYEDRPHTEDMGK